MKDQADLAVLSELFGDNRAEWSPDKFRELFVQPSYFSKLESKRPALLVGGRGTGKTTSLRSLRFDATHERLTSQGLTYGDQTHLGIFIRINKNHVRAFQGGSVSADTWQKAFAHYFNLLACAELCELVMWLEDLLAIRLSQQPVQRIAKNLALDTTDCSIDGLKAAISDALSKLQLYVNNPQSSTQPLFSLAEAPLALFATILSEEGLLDERVIFCCVDEYENLLDEQQALLNTYIKHACPPLSYKVGVRQNGLRTHRTIDANDLLSTPDDYRQIDIVEEGFDNFAHDVAQLRLLRARERGLQVPSELGDFFEDLSFVEEARLLGADDIAAEVLEELKAEPTLHEHFASRPTAETFLLKYWSEVESQSVAWLARDWVSAPEKWANRINNYGYASLFWLSRGRKGVRIRKYYSGSRTLLSLSGGNIRYFLELIDGAISAEENLTRVGGVLRISARAQTLGARFVGQRRLNQIEHLAERGPELKRLVLAIGKVFFEFAREPVGRAPEVTSFVLTGDAKDVRSAEDLLKEGVAHLAIEATPRTKPTTQFEVRDDEYRLHPIYCAFFEISHRRKRRATFDATDLLGVLGDKPGKSISKLLGDSKQSPLDEIPQQMALFTGFFNAGRSLP
ncbi:MAG TPA: hypothetical protein DDW98_14795 [Gammaproteobacteria bacterium]|nr:hypothetical protein [Gammaproteobacteria bacterium]